jgi:hypothetical protein
MDNQLETESITPLFQSAVRLNEIYRPLMAGRFTDDQARFCIAKMTKPNE